MSQKHPLQGSLVITNTSKRGECVRSHSLSVLCSRSKPYLNATVFECDRIWVRTYLNATVFELTIFEHFRFSLFLNIFSYPHFFYSLFFLLPLFLDFPHFFYPHFFLFQFFSPTFLPVLFFTPTFFGFPFFIPTIFYQHFFPFQFFSPPLFLLSFFFIPTFVGFSPLYFLQPLFFTPAFFFSHFFYSNVFESCGGRVSLILVARGPVQSSYINSFYFRLTDANIISSILLPLLSLVSPYLFLPAQWLIMLNIIWNTNHKS